MTEKLILGAGTYEIGESNECVRKHTQKEYYIFCV